MMSELVVALTVIVLSGITIAAYRHPDQFPKVAKVLAGAFGIAFLWILVWQCMDVLMSSSTLAHMAREMPESTLGSQQDDIFEIADSIRILGTTVLGTAGLIGYLGFLLLLPKWGITAERSASKKDA